MAPITRVNQIQVEPGAAFNQVEIHPLQSTAQISARPQTETQSTINKMNIKREEEEKHYFISPHFEQSPDKEEDKYLSKICDKFTQNPTEKENEALAPCPNQQRAEQQESNNKIYVSPHFEQFPDKKKNKHLSEICDKFIQYPTEEEKDAIRQLCPKENVAERDDKNQMTHFGEQHIEKFTEENDQNFIYICDKIIVNSNEEEREISTLCSHDGSSVRGTSTINRNKPVVIDVMSPVAERDETPEGYYDGKFQQFPDKKKDKHLSEICNKFVQYPTEEEKAALSKCKGAAMKTDTVVTKHETPVPTIDTVIPKNETAPVLKNRDGSNAADSFTTIYLNEIKPVKDSNYYSIVHNRTIDTGAPTTFNTNDDLSRGIIGISIIILVLAGMMFGIKAHERRQKKEKDVEKNGLLPTHNEDTCGWERQELFGGRVESEKKKLRRESAEKKEDEDLIYIV